MVAVDEDQVQCVVEPRSSLLRRQLPQPTTCAVARQHPAHRPGLPRVVAHAVVSTDVRVNTDQSQKRHVLEQVCRCEPAMGSHFDGLQPLGRAPRRMRLPKANLARSSEAQKTQQLQHDIKTLAFERGVERHEWSAGQRPIRRHVRMQQRHMQGHDRDRRSLLEPLTPGSQSSGGVATAPHAPEARGFVGRLGAARELAQGVGDAEHAGRGSSRSRTKCLRCQQRELMPELLQACDNPSVERPSVGKDTSAAIQVEGVVLRFSNLGCVYCNLV
mmetsp:Transcript_20111/g.69761  ORF Transcript_20111/g.69761 Transcript_20111/m.69761 type:complete len:273 (+) Transcript_20111:128-946(+)